MSSRDSPQPDMFPPERIVPRPEEYDAAACDYQADHGLTYSKMCEAMRQYGTLSEIHERAQVIAAPLREPLASVGSRNV